MSRFPIVAILVASLGSAGCRNEAALIQDQQRAFVSLRATVMAVGDAWLSGNVSSTFASTALETTQQLIEKQRAELTTSPDLLAHPEAAEVSDAENRLGQRAAQIWKAIGDGDGDTVGRHLASVAALRVVPP